MWYSASRVDSLLIHHRLQGCACNAPRHSKLISPHLPPLFRRRAHYTVPAAQYNRHETGTHEQALGLIPPSLCDCTGINSTLACCACHRPRGLNGSRCQQQRTYGDGDGDGESGRGAPRGCTSTGRIGVNPGSSCSGGNAVTTPKTCHVRRRPSAPAAPATGGTALRPSR